MPNMGKYAKYAYLGAPNMVKWVVPEKMLQNAVHWSGGAGETLSLVLRSVEWEVVPFTRYLEYVGGPHILKMCNDCVQRSMKYS